MTPEEMATVEQAESNELKRAKRRARPTRKSRARSKTEQRRGNGTADQKEQRVRHCMVLMARGQWIPAVTADALTRRWQVSTKTMDTYAGEASRRLRAGIMLDEDLRAAVLSTLQTCAADAETITARCLKTKQLRTAVEAIRAKVDATKAMAGVAGVEAAKKVEVGGNLSDLFGLVHDGKVKPSQE